MNVSKAVKRKGRAIERYRTAKQQQQQQQHRPQQQQQRRIVRYTTETEIRAALIEFVVFVVFLIVATNVCLSVRDPYMFFFNNAIEHFFVERNILNKYKFTDLLTVQDYYDWVTFSFLNALHTDDRLTPPDKLNDTVVEEFLSFQPVKGHYKGVHGGGTGLYSHSNTSASSFLADNILLGPPRLRQIRLTNSSCYHQSKFIKLFKTCYASYRQNGEDTSIYKGTPFRTMNELKVLEINAITATYYGGGYVQMLTYNIDENIAILQGLRNISWIDRATRLVVLEFNMFNNNTDIFASVKLLSEVLPTGGILTSAQLRTVKKYSFLNEPNWGNLIAFAAFYLLIVYYTMKELLEMKKEGFRHYFSDFVNLLDWAVILLAYLALGYNAWHGYHMKELEKFYKHPNVYYSLDTILHWNMIYLNMMATMVFIIWMKLFKFISFNKTLIHFTKTLKRCAIDLAGFFLMFSIVFLSYAQVGLLLFGNEHPGFQDFRHSVLTMTRLILKDFQYSLLNQANSVLGPVFFITYMIFVIFVLLNVFLGIVMEAYNTVKSVDFITETHVCSYIMMKLRNIYKTICRPCKKCRRKPRDEVAPDRVVEMHKNRPSKTRETRYFDDVPPEVKDIELYHLENRILLLGEILEELVANMKSIISKYEREQQRFEETRKLTEDFNAAVIK